MDITNEKIQSYGRLIDHLLYLPDVLDSSTLPESVLINVKQHHAPLHPLVHLPNMWNPKTLPKSVTKIM